MTNRLNKTAICSVVFMDIVDYSKRSISEQIAEKALFTQILTEAVKHLVPDERIILDTGDGAAITFTGEPEEALFVSLAVRNDIFNYNKTADAPLILRIGLNLGPVRMVSDINGQLNVIGDAINDAQRVMSFAEPNQILVSRSYYEVVSRLTKDFTNMFSYFGIKQDKHVREHEVYQINPGINEIDAKNSLLQDNDGKKWTKYNGVERRAASRNHASGIGLLAGWKYLVWATLSVSTVFIALSLGVFSRPGRADATEQKLLHQHQLAEKTNIEKAVIAVPNSAKVEVKQTPVSGRAVKISKIKDKPEIHNKHNEVVQYQQKKENTSPENNCSQAAIAMNQCVK